MSHVSCLMNNTKDADKKNKETKHICVNLKRKPNGQISTLHRKKNVILGPFGLSLFLLKLKTGTENTVAKYFLNI